MGVRVRFDVPAGGQLDLASARAALYGWLWARHEGGVFLLYLREPLALPALASVAADLRLLGLDWDGEVEGEPPATAHVFGTSRLPGEASPEYVHLPRLEGPEASTPVRAWIDRGYSGSALANTLARLGWTPRGRRALLSLEELAEHFELGRVSRQPVAFDQDNLDWFNRRWLAGLDAKAVTALLSPHWQMAYGRAERAEGTALSATEWRETLALAIREELVLPEQAVDKARFAFVDVLCSDEASRAVLQAPYADPILDAFGRELGSVEPFESDPLDAFCRGLRLRFKERLGIRSRDVMYVLRAALSGRQDGPCLVEICQLLGPARCVQRANRARRAGSGHVDTRFCKS